MNLQERKTSMRQVTSAFIAKTITQEQYLQRMLNIESVYFSDAIRLNSLANPFTVIVLQCYVNQIMTMMDDDEKEMYEYLKQNTTAFVGFGKAGK